MRERTHGEPTRAENERRDTWKRIGKRAEDDNLGTEWSCPAIGSGSQNFDRSEEIGISFEVGANGYLKIAKVTHANRINFYVSRCVTLRATEFNALLIRTLRHYRKFIFIVIIKSYQSQKSIM